MSVDLQAVIAAGNQPAIFAGGCFWCMEPPFIHLDGVVSTLSGYTGGTVVDPGYDAICTGRTGHYEAVCIVYNPAKITYPYLLDVFWRNIDPTQRDGQFADRGSQYKTAVFYCNPQQQQQAEESRQALAASGRFAAPIVTEILPAAPFYAAEDYHQQYFRKQPGHYAQYSIGSGRKAFIEKNQRK